MKRLATCLALAAVLHGCASDQEDSSTPKASVAIAEAGGLSVELLTDSRLETGMTPIYLRVKTQAGQAITDATVSFKPMMAMTGGTSHGAPVIGTPTVGGDGLYRCDVVFQMASSAMGSWSATVTVQRPGAAAPVDVAFPSLPVAETGCAKVFSYTDPASPTPTKYVASMDLKEKAKVGVNPVVLTLHRMQDMMTFVPVENATLTLHPWMTSMGHGSRDSVATARSPGVYDGDVSFSMPGDWDTTVTVQAGGVTLGTPKFSIEF